MSSRYNLIKWAKKEKKRFYCDTVNRCLFNLITWLSGNKIILTFFFSLSCYSALDNLMPIMNQKLKLRFLNVVTHLHHGNTIIRLSNCRIY